MGALWEETGQEAGSGADVLGLPGSQPGGISVGCKTKFECGVQLLSSGWKKAPGLTSVTLKDGIKGHRL